ncbi:MAG: methylmalonyl-CoA epimerase [Candidatus Rokuibacteriota bacterium]
MVRRLHHVAIVVRRVAEAYQFYRDTLGLPLLKEASIPEQGVRAALLAAGPSEIELIEPTDATSGVARYLDRHGESLHHLCFEVADLDSALPDLERRGVELIDRVPRHGLAGRIAFLHPRACAGILVELATPDADPEAAPSPLELKRVVIGASDPRATAQRFTSLLALPEVAMNDGRRVLLAAGPGALLVVPADEVGGSEGMVALSFVAEEFSALTQACDRSGVKLRRGTGEVTIDPVSSHGVHLHISRYRFP